MQHFETLAGLCSCAGGFESYLVANPDDRSARDVAHIWATAYQNQQNEYSEDRSAWASAQSDQSVRCPYEETLDP